ncbi:MAG: Rrf2 family transcriptional regulator, partial [Candidatus Kapabacteria bacterium]|nr:Rrf2 family transcriptional regulator [Candidatus Kapabacteria bacterium]
MIYVAMNKQEGVNMPISKIADDLHIPFHFLKKILQSLGENGLLRTQRSAKGGVSLAKDASEISIYDIIKVLD